MRRVAGIALAALAVSGTPAAAATPTSDPDAVATAILADPATLNAAKTAWEELPAPAPDAGAPAGPFPAAVSYAPLAGFPTAPPQLAILSTGDAAVADSRNVGEATTTEYPGDNGARHGNSAFDVTVLRIGVTVPARMSCMSLDYRFLSEEYREFADGGYGDAFVAELDPPGGVPAWSTEGGTITRPGDFASAAEGAPVTVSTATMSRAEASGTTYDGATQLLTTKRPITRGSHVILLSVFDQGDRRYDSAVLLDGLRFTNEPATTCRPPTLPAAVAPALPAPPRGEEVTPPPSNEFAVRAAGARLAILVPGPGRLVVRGKGLLKLRRSVREPGTVTVTVRASAAGRKILRRRHRLAVRVAVTYTPKGGRPRTHAKRVTLRTRR